jgi:hypothetical protein
MTLGVSDPGSAGRFSVSVIVPFVNERESIVALMDALLGEANPAVCQVLVVSGARTTDESMRVLRGLAGGYRWLRHWFSRYRC